MNPSRNPTTFTGPDGTELSPASRASLDVDFVLDQLVDECHFIQQWLRDNLVSASELLDASEPLDVDYAAWKIVMSLLARDAAQLPPDVMQRLDARVEALGLGMDAKHYEADGARLTGRMLALVATKVSTDARDPESAPEIARSLVDDLHDRLQVCIGCLEWLAGLREGKLSRRNTLRDTHLADQAYSEALSLIGGRWH